MSNWKAVYRRKRRAKEDEAFACVSCGVQYEPENRSEGCHSLGPSNGICVCGKTHMKVASNAYLENYGLVRWER